MRNKKHFIFPIILAFTILITGISSGFGIWLFTGDKSSATLQYDPEKESDTNNKVKMDDIAENYFFAANLDSNNYYTVYFFAQPELANHESYSGTASIKVTDNTKTTEMADAYQGYVITYNGNTGYFAPTSTSNVYKGTINGTTYYFNASVTTAARTKASSSYTAYFYLFTSESDAASEYTYTSTSGWRSYTLVSPTTGVGFSTSFPSTYFYSSDNSSVNYVASGDDYVATIDGTTYYYSPTSKKVTYINGTATVTGPNGYYDANSSSYSDDTKGYWGTRSAGSDSYWGSGVYNTDGTSDGTAYGYKVFTNVYKQLSTSQYSSIGDCFRTDSNWYAYFAGFTSDASVAKANASGGSKNLPAANNKMLDLTKTLADYDTNGDHVVYFYAVYTNGDDSATSNTMPGVHIIKEGDINAPYMFQWMFLPTSVANQSGNKNTDFTFYYVMNSVYIEDTTPSTGSNNTTFYKDKNYIIDCKSLASSGWTRDDWTQSSSKGYKSLKDDTDLYDYLDAGCFYNFIVYYNQNTTQSNVQSANSTVEATILSQHNILYTWENKGFTSHDGSSYCYMKLYVEKIYDYRVTGDISGSYNYNDKDNALLNIGDDGVVRDGYNIYESGQISFMSSDYTTFSINYGGWYDNGILKKDTTDSSDTDDQVFDSDGNQMTNPSGSGVYYGTTDDRDTGNLNGFTILTPEQTTEDNSTIQRIKLNHPGVYKIRVKVKYTNGVPSEIKVAVAYLSGLFIEIHDTDPTDTIQGTGFVDHKNNYTYKAVFTHYKEDGVTHSTFTPYDKVFIKKGSGESDTRYALSDIIEEKNASGAYLVDHVVGSMTRCELHDGKYMFTTDGGITYTDAFTLDKNHIFYFEYN